MSATAPRDFQKATTTNSYNSGPVELSKLKIADVQNDYGIIVILNIL
jgi:hypothetical protein